MKSNSAGLFFLGLFVAAGVAAGGYFVGQTMYNAKVALNTAEAKGLAERRVKANVANWSISFTNEGESEADIRGLYEESKKDQQTIIKKLKEIGFTDDEIQIGALEYYNQEYRDNNQQVVDESHRLEGTIGIETSNVDIVGKARAQLNELIAEGINLRSYAPRYSFTNLNEIKPDMLKEATKNARIAANEFAENAGVNVGGIRSARQGSFFIRDAGEEYGDTAKIEKDVRVVTTITFYLTE